jgi:transposase-like protein
LYKTDSFKEIYGDWERLARIEGIDGIKPKTYTPVNGILKDNMKEYFKTFGFIKNNSSTKPIEARFPRSIAGKIIVDQGVKTDTLTPYLREIFENAFYAYNEDERKNQKLRPSGTKHKSHPDVIQYHNFVNKFVMREINNTENEYFIRFIVYEKKDESLIHASFISKTELYTGNGLIHSRNTNLAKKPSTRIDYDLSEFFNSVNPSDTGRAHYAGTGWE